MKANELITSVFTKLGTSLPAEIQTQLSSSSLANIEVAEDVAKKFSAEYFTLESAKANPEIRNAIKAEVLNGTDAEIDRLMGKFEFDEDTKTKVKAGDKTSKKLELLADQIKELTEKKAGKGAETQTALNEKIAELNAQVLAEKEGRANDIKAENDKFKTEKINWELKDIYKGFDYALAADKNISITMAQALINDINKSKGLKFESSDTGIRIVTKEGADYFENNVKLSPSDYINKELLANKLIKVSDKPAETHTQTQRTVNAQQNFGNTSFASAIDNMIERQ
jgi:hypothetical protein